MACGAGAASTGAGATGSADCWFRAGLPATELAGAVGLTGSGTLEAAWAGAGACSTGAGAGVMAAVLVPEDIDFCIGVLFGVAVAAACLVTTGAVTSGAEAGVVASAGAAGAGGGVMAAILAAGLESATTLAGALFMVVKLYNRFRSNDDKEKAALNTNDLLVEIRDELRATRNNGQQ